MKYLIANHKMNLKLNEIDNYINNIRHYNFNKLIISCSPIYLSKFNENKLLTCAQNIHEKDSGSYTGEVSASQIKSLGTNFSLIGHSERRNKFNESSIMINKK